MIIFSGGLWYINNVEPSCSVVIYSLVSQAPIPQFQNLAVLLQAENKL